LCWCTQVLYLQSPRWLKGQFFRSYQFFTILLFQLGSVASMSKNAYMRFNDDDTESGVKYEGFFCRWVEVQKLTVFAGEFHYEKMEESILWWLKGKLLKNMMKK
jgi:hypothetical protein